MRNEAYHEPVLLDKAVEGLAIQGNGTYVDATLGGGGHAKAILQQLDDGLLFVFDMDPDARPNVPEDPRVWFIEKNFRYMKNFLKWHNAIPVDGVLADLGFASHHIDDPARGFTYRTDAPLDMRMGRQEGRSAADIVNTYSHRDLKKVLGTYGELKKAGIIASRIIDKRKEQRIARTLELIDAIQDLAPAGKENQFYSRVFQAIRMEVNDEVPALRDFLSTVPDVLKPQGRLVTIAYHSLEDQLTKRFMKHGNFGGEPEKDFYGNPRRPLRPLFKKPVTPEAAETEKNPRARSAKLRVAERIEENEKTVA